MTGLIGKTLAAAGCAAILGAAAPAAAYVFTIDPDASSVTLTDSSGACWFGTDCGVDARLADDFAQPAEFVLDDAGESHSFDFLTFTSDGGWGSETFEISATLAFETPAELTTTGSGSGSSLTFGGFIAGGSLVWTDLPSTVTLADGAVVSVDFEGGAGLFLGSSVTTGATVSLVSEGSGSVSAVPLPAPALLLLSALGVFGIAGLRRAA